ncbi:hypothetical protein [Methylobacterium nonmethylotrophicum]|uniref:Uncharacterized protein n=1 Tax=Methylobacterium nonmethylotrophicum TaxID=1141884 RepID=A0A4Z0NE21_9HYPH|nr:hypothetical protein [Methylobacterium nonmethylotrophicum]TGD91910.1 hypothetical protein EU555_35380 [Methylobacterium nonmethylotrophicum]
MTIHTLITAINRSQARDWSDLSLDLRQKLFRALVKIESRDAIVDPDGSRLAGSLTHTQKDPRQTRAGQDLDAAAARDALAVIAKNLADAPPSQIDRVHADLISAAEKIKPSAFARRKRASTLCNLRTTCRALVAARRVDGTVEGEAWLGTLIDIEAELGVHYGSAGEPRHVDALTLAMPLTVNVILGRDVVEARLSDRIAAYDALVRDELLSAYQEGRSPVIPETVTGTMIGARHAVTHAEIAVVRPQRHGIRTCDADARDAEYERKHGRPRRRTHRKTRPIPDKATLARLRENEALEKFYQRQPRTVKRWSDEKRAAMIAGMTAVTGVTGCHALAESPILYRALGQNVTPAVTGVTVLTRAMRQALRDHYHVGDAAIRKWRERGTLSARIAGLPSAIGLDIATSTATAPTAEPADQDEGVISALDHVSGAEPPTTVAPTNREKNVIPVAASVENVATAEDPVTFLRSDASEVAGDSSDQGVRLPANNGPCADLSFVDLPVPCIKPFALVPANDEADVRMMPSRARNREAETYARLIAGAHAAALAFAELDHWPA